jgi:hypothetical protein
MLGIILFTTSIYAIIIICLFYQVHFIVPESTIYTGCLNITAARLGLSFGAGMGRFNQEKINRAVDDFPGRLDAVIAARGKHFE